MRGALVVGVGLAVLLGASPAGAEPVSVRAAGSVEVAGSVESISVAVVPGELVISVDLRPLRLPAVAREGGWYTASGVLSPVTVTDTRAGNPGWSASGQLSELVGESATVGAEWLSWSPVVVDQSAVQVVTAGPSMAGLGSSRVLALAGPDAGRGTAHLTAGLHLLVRAPGPYAATLTLTVI
ncbi:hypothetical protein [Actinokineospora sp. NBRC 105648]|uniref:hypothetical protein n=1 Tax=Actinokineospora sp. NBRC 105648 TaxID=3032206 RepID=UPI002552BAC2|nr:hypothetical protein [Actinokineospora sp. NBRC 105648]